MFCQTDIYNPKIKTISSDYVSKDKDNDFAIRKLSVAKVYDAIKESF